LSNSDQACDCMSTIDRPDDGLRTQTFAYIPYVEELYGKLNWKPLIDILRRSYWDRQWITQELTMNHQDTLFICGNRAFSREDLREILAICRGQSLRIQQWLRTSSEDSMTKEQANLCVRISGMQCKSYCIGS
jgi:hypothetical protein